MCLCEGNYQKNNWPLDFYMIKLEQENNNIGLTPFFPHPYASIPLPLPSQKWSGQLLQQIFDPWIIQNLESTRNRDRNDSLTRKISRRVNWQNFNPSSWKRTLPSDLLNIIHCYLKQTLAFGSEARWECFFLFHNWWH